MKYGLIALGAVLVLALLLTIWAMDYFFRFAVVRKKPSRKNMNPRWM